MKYRAFISYSHAGEGPELAKALHVALHKLGRSWHQLRARNVFRDQSNLSAAPLWPTIQGALEDSAFLIYMASPEAARSAWVRKEIGWWLTSRDASTLIVVLSSGQAIWDETAGAFDAEQSSAIPDSLRTAFAFEPYIVDLRWCNTKDAQLLRNPQFKDQIAQIAATLDGKTKDEVIGEDIERSRRARRLAGSAVALLALLFVVSVVAAVGAVRSANREAEQRVAAEQARDRADRERRAAIGVQALRIAEEGDATTALLVANEVLEGDLNGEHESAALRALFAVTNGTTMTSIVPVSTRGIRRLAAAGNWIVAVDDGGDASITNVQGPAERIAPEAVGFVQDIAIDAEGKSVVFSDGDGQLTAVSVQGEVQWKHRFTDTNANTIAYNDARKEYVVGFLDGGALAFDRTRSVWGRVPLEVQTLSRDLTYQGRLIVRAVDDGSVIAHDVTTNRTVRRRFGDSPITALASSSRADLFAALTLGGSIHTFRINKSSGAVEIVSTRRVDHGLAVAVAMNEDGSLLAAAGGDEIHVWSNASGHQIARVHVPAGAIHCLAFLGGNTLLGGGSDGRIYVWSVRNPWQPTSIAASTDEWHSDFDSSRAGMMSAVGKEGSLRVLDLQVRVLREAKNVSAANFVSEDEIRLVRDREAIVLNIKDGKERLVLRFDPGEEILTTSAGGMATKAGNSVNAYVGDRKLSFDQERPATSATISASGGAIAIFDEQGVTIRALTGSDGREPLRINGSFGAGAFFAPDDAYVAIPDSNGGVLLQSLGGKNLLRNLIGPLSHVTDCVWASPSVKGLACGSFDGVARVWDPESGDLKFASSQGSSGISALGATADLSMISAGHYDGTVTVWHAPTQTRLSEFKGEDFAEIREVMLMPHLSSIAVADVRGRVGVWRAVPITTALIDELLAHAPRRLSNGELVQYGVTARSASDAPLSKLDRGRRDCFGFASQATSDPQLPEQIIIAPTVFEAAREACTRLLEQAPDDKCLAGAIGVLERESRDEVMRQRGYKRIERAVREKCTGSLAAYVKIAAELPNHSRAEALLMDLAASGVPEAVGALITLADASPGGAESLRRYRQVLEERARALDPWAHYGLGRLYESARSQDDFRAMMFHYGCSLHLRHHFPNFAADPVAIRLASAAGRATLEDISTTFKKVREQCVYERGKEILADRVDHAWGRSSAECQSCRRSGEEANDLLGEPKRRRYLPRADAPGTSDPRRGL